MIVLRAESLGECSEVNSENMSIMADAWPSEEKDLSSPPPYSPRQTPSSDASQPSLFASHLDSLQSQLRVNRVLHASVREQEDSDALALIVPQLELLIASISKIHPPPVMVEATFVPRDSVGLDWQLTDRDEELRGEVRRVIRVMNAAKDFTDAKTDLTQRQESGGSSAVTQYENADALWWHDEEMTQRLAKHLRPERPKVVAVDRRPSSDPAGKKKDRSRWSLGLFSKDDARSSPVPMAPSGPKEDTEEEVAMDVTADEVTFRRETRMGLWESKTGWGVVVSISLKR